MLKKSRMDCVPVLAPDGELRIVEFRNLVQGDSVVLGRTDDGSEGILMHTEGFFRGRQKRRSVRVPHRAQPGNGFHAGL